VTERASTSTGRLERFSIGTAQDWMEWSGIALADVANEDDDPSMKLGAVGFTRAPCGARSEFEFEYDEVLIVTGGACTVRSGDRSVTARRGEVIYLRAGTPGTFHADSDVELVYVASPPYGRVNRAARAELLGRASR
jgi:ethanolamine utilization protein EutQ (cupin superfamily)